MGSDSHNYYQDYVYRSLVVSLYKTGEFYRLTFDAMIFGTGTSTIGFGPSKDPFIFQYPVFWEHDLSKLIQFLFNQVNSLKSNGILVLPDDG